MSSSEREIHNALSCKRLRTKMQQLRIPNITYSDPTVFFTEIAKESNLQK